MGRVGSFFRSAVKPLALVGAAGALAVSLVVTTPSNAQAFVLPPIPPPVIAGATEAILPSLLAGLGAITPVGWVIIGTVGLAAVTQDYWMPYVPGLFGQGDTNKTSGPPTSGQPTPQSFISLAQPVLTGDGKGISWPVNVTLQNSSGSLQMSYLIDCKNDSDGAIRHLGTAYNMQSRTYPSSWSETVSCNYSDNYGSHTGTPQGFRAGNPGSDGLPFFTPGTGGWGPGNLVMWGSFTTGGFDPRSPSVVYHSAVECLTDDGQKVTITADSTGDMNAVKVPSCAARGLGHATGKTTITADTPKGLAQPVWSVPAPAADANHPLCGAQLAGSLCKLSVSVDGKPCVIGDYSCIRWATINQATPARVSCQYGEYTVATSECNLLERAYEVGGTPATDANVDGNPATRSSTDPNGNTVPKNSTGTGTGTVPGTGGQPDPAADQQSKDCFPTGWGMLNPVDWVLKPLRCAFVPTADITGDGNRLKDKAMTKAPLSMVAAIGATAPTSVGGQGQCPAWVVNVGWSTPGQNGNFSKNVVCDSSFIQAIVNARPVLFGLISAGMLWPFLRSLWYAMIPVVRVIPTGGK